MRPTMSKTAVRAEAKDKVMEGMEGGLGGIDRGRRFGIQTPLLLESGDNRGALLPEFALSALLGFSFVLDSKSDGGVQRFGKSLVVSG
jgi:hypothetical protein